MKIFSYLSDDTKIENSTFVLGAFETIHNGHVELIKTAQSLGQPVVVCVFRDPALLPKTKDANLLQLEIRLMFLAQLKVDYVIILDFDDWLKHLEAKKFIDLLIKKGASKFVIGKDYRFGALGQWSALELQNYFPETKIIDLVKENNIKVATTLIKENVIFGDLKYVNSQLAFNYAIKLDFQQANQALQWPDKITKLAKGIYAANLIFNNREFHGIAHINFEQKVVIKILDFDYDFILTDSLIIEFLEKIRIIISREKDQISDFDIKSTKEFFVNKLSK